MLRFTGVLAALIIFGSGPLLSNEAAAVVQDWPLVFDPTVVHHLNLSTMAPSDTTCIGAEDSTSWTSIQQDATFTVELPALFWADGETPMCVSLRRKSADPLGPPLDPKISLKIDVNQLVPGQRWHLLRKLSLENGDDVNTAAEGIAWQLQNLAANAATAPADMTPGLASWVTLAVNGTEYGIYVNVEQKDKSFLQNRGIFDSGASWIYKIGDLFKLVYSPLGVDSPTQTSLCYSPFEPTTCATPDDATIESDLNSMIDMDVMLAQGAVETFLAAKDALFSKGKNFYYFDAEAPLTYERRYTPWDLDSVLSALASDTDVYCSNGGACSDMEQIILGHPTFGPQFDIALCKLLDDPFQLANLNTIIDDTETTITAALVADPNNNIGTPIKIVNYFNGLRTFMANRITSIQSQVTCPTACTAHIDCNDGNVCTDDVCDFVSGFCTNPNNTASCNDGVSCTSSDVCAAGVCGGTDTCAAGTSCEASANACITDVVVENFSGAQSGGNVTSLLINTPAGTVEDDLLIAVVTTDGNQSASLAPPGGQGWTALDVSQEGSAVTLGAWWKLAGASEPASHTWTWGGSEAAYGHMTRITGHDTATPIEVSAIGGGSSANPTAPALTVTFPGSLILRIGGFDDNDITVGDAGIATHATITMDDSGAGNNNSSSGAAWSLRGGSSSVSTADFTLTATEQWRTISLAVTPEPLAGGACGDGILDVGEDCDEGASNGTPGSCCGATCSFVAAATECRASAGTCDVAEVCSGASGTCPVDGFASAATECRASAGTCDIAESCTGSGALCPGDGFEPGTTECRASAGICDVAESCTGSGALCPGDGFEPGTTECRASAGGCDIAEDCTGSGTSCPADVVRPSETLCRIAIGFCDVQEVCDGVSSSCPADGFLPDGTLCVDGDVCNGEEQCQTGSCTAGPPLDCDDADPCTALSCDEITGCAYTPIPMCGEPVPSATPPVLMLISLILLVAGGVLVAQRRQGRA